MLLSFKGVKQAHHEVLSDSVHGFRLMQEVKFQPDLLRQLIHGRDQVKVDLCVLHGMQQISANA